MGGSIVLVVKHGLQTTDVIFDVFVNPTEFEKQAPHPKY